MGNIARLLTTAIVAPFIAISSFAAVNTVYVRADGDNGNDGSAPGTAKLTIAAAIAAAGTGDIIDIGEGTFQETVTMNKQLTLHGAGAGTTIIEGLTNQPHTIIVGVSNSVVESLTVTRAGNDSTNWESNTNNSGLAFNQLTTNITVQDCEIVGCRNGIYLNRNEDFIIRRNDIHNNRTGIQLVNTTTGTSVTNNFIRDNHTVGVVIYNNSNLYSSQNVHVNDNSITGNWYAAMQVRTQSYNNPYVYDLSRNYLGGAVTFTYTNSTEGGYNLGTMPAEFGGTETSPGTFEGVVGGSNSAMLDYSPYLYTSTDNDASDGYTPDYTSLRVVSNGGQYGSTGRIQEAVNIVTAGDTVRVEPGTYSGNVRINKNMAFLSTSGRDSTTIEGTWAGGNGTVYVYGTITDLTIGLPGAGFHIMGIDGTAGNEAAALYFKGDTMSGVTVAGNRITAQGDAAISGEWNAPYDNFTIAYNDIDGKTFNGDNPAGLSSAAQFTLANYPRQAVVFGGGAGTTNTKNFKFQYNNVSTITGGMSVTNNAGATIAATPHGNYVMTLDLLGSNYVNNNDFSSYTLKGAALRMRPVGGTISNDIYNNTFSGTYPLNFETNPGVDGNALAASVLTGANTFVRMAYAQGTAFIAQSIQAAFDAAIADSMVTIWDGTYNESPTLAVRADVYGQGAGTNIRGTLGVNVSGNSGADPLTIANLRLSNSSSHGLAIGANASHIDFNYMTIDSNAGSGVNFAAGTASDIQFMNNVVKHNATNGFRLGGGVNMSDLTLQNTVVDSNGVIGFAFNPSGSANTTLTGLHILDCTFNYNGTLSFSQTGTIGLGHGDISLFAFNGDAEIKRTMITGGDSNPAHIGLQIRGSNTPAACGTVEVDSVYIFGDYLRPEFHATNPGGPGYGMYISNYNDISNLSIKNTACSTNVASALAVAGLSGTLVLDNTVSLSSDGGFHIEAQSSSYNNVYGVVDATNAYLGGSQPGDRVVASESFDLANKIMDRLDESSDAAKRAYVILYADRAYVTNENSASVQIQNAIDVSDANEVVHIRSGNYPKQIATGRLVLGVHGPHQFGWFVDKPLSIIGYNIMDLPAGAGEASVEITTGATNSFGPAGIFVQADSVSLSGLLIGSNFNNSNAVANDKTIEVIGNNVSIINNTIQPQEGSIYLGEWNAASYAANRIQSYTIDSNTLTNTVVSINNGVGVAGDVSGRLITSNIFTGDPNEIAPYSLSFRGWNGASPVQGWIVYPVGGAVVTGNTFNQPVANIVQTRGNTGGYDESQFDWESIATNNSFGNNVIDLETESPFVPRAFTDGAGYTNTRRITNTIANGMATAQNNDIIRVGAGSYDESPILTNNTVQIKSAIYGDAELSGDNYFIFGTTGLGDANFANWDDFNTFEQLGVNTSGSIQDAASFVNPSGTVHVFAGTYNLSSTVTLDSGITVAGPAVSDVCNFAPTVVIACSSNVRTFDIAGTSTVTLSDVELNIGTGSSNRFFRVTSSGNLDISNIVFRRNGTRLYGVNNAGVQADRDIPKFIDDGNDAGFGTGKVVFGDKAPMNTSSIVAAWKGDDANAAQVASVLDYSGNALTLTQATLTRKPTRAEISGNYVITSGVTKYVTANVNSTVHGGEERTLFVAFRSAASSTAAIVYKQGDQTNGISVWTNTGNQAGIDLNIGGSNYKFSATTTTNTWYIAQVYFNGNASDNRVGMTIHGIASPSESHWDDDVVTADTLPTPSGVNAVISLGARQGYSTRNGTALTANTLGDAFTGSIGEVIVLNSADAAVRDDVYCMLNRKWNAGATSNELEKDDMPVVAGESEPSITNVYPNPASDMVSVDVVPAATEDVRVSIVNTMGVEVATVFNGMVEGGFTLPLNADVSGLNSGAYMMIVTGNVTRLSVPFMVQR